MNFLLTFLAMRCLIESLRDVRWLLILSIFGSSAYGDNSNTAVTTDADLMSIELTNGIIPPFFFALLVLCVCGIIFFVSVYLAFVSNGEHDTSSSSKTRPRFGSGVKRFFFRRGRRRSEGDHGDFGNVEALFGDVRWHGGGVVRV